MDSDTDTNANQSQASLESNVQPIKKSPREFIIPIAVEGGGFITPRGGSLEPSESQHKSINSAISPFGRTRRIGCVVG